jgi:putative transposase
VVGAHSASAGWLLVLLTVSTLECELFDQQPGSRFNSRHEAKHAVFDHLETFYNPRRRHSAIGQIAPAVFEPRHQERPAA